MNLVLLIQYISKFLLFTPYYLIVQITVKQFCKRLTNKQLNDNDYLLPYFEFFCIQKDLQQTCMNIKQLCSLFTFNENQQPTNKFTIYNEEIREDLIKCEQIINFLEKYSEIKEYISKNINTVEQSFILLEQYQLISKQQKIRIMRVFTYYLMNQIIGGLTSLALLYDEQKQYIIDKLILFYQELLPQLQHENISSVTEIIVQQNIQVIQLLTVEQQIQQYESLISQLGLSIHKNLRTILLKQLLKAQEQDHSGVAEIVIRQKHIFNVLLSDYQNIQYVIQLIGNSLPLNQALQEFDNFKYIFLAQNSKILRAAYKFYDKLQVEDIYQICLYNNTNYTSTQFIIEQSQYEPIQQDIQDLLKQNLNHQQMILVICLLNISNFTVELENKFIQQLIQQENMGLIQYITNQNVIQILYQNLQQPVSLTLMPAYYPNDNNLQQSIDEINQQISNQIQISDRLNLIQYYILLLLRMKEKQQINSSYLLDQLLNHINYCIQECLQQIDQQLLNIKTIYMYLSVIYQSFPKLLQVCQQIDTMFINLFIQLYDYKYSIYDQIDQAQDQQTKKQLESKIKDIDNMSLQQINIQNFSLLICFLVTSLDLPVFQTQTTHDIINSLKQNQYDSLIEIIVQTIKIIQNEQIIKNSKYLKQDDIIHDCIQLTNHIYSYAIRIDQQWRKDWIKCAVITQKMGIIGVGKSMNQKTQELIQRLVEQQDQDNLDQEQLE